MSRQIQDLDPVQLAEVEITDLLPFEDISEPKTKKITIGQLSRAIANVNTPIGSLYYNGEVDLDPSDESLLGFGTWERYGEGYAIVGVKGDNPRFSTGGQKTGTETVTLNANQMPVHNHPGSTSQNGEHNHGTAGDPVYTSGGGNQRAQVGGSGQQFRWSIGGNQPAGNHSHSVGTENRGGGQAHDNVQPSIAVYIWKRVG